jgi:hypothetical protein
VAQVSTSRDDVVELSDFAWLRLRRRMDGLTDQEYLWEPVANCRSIRPRADGSYVWDGPAPIGDPRVFTTLAWRLCHIIDFLTQARNGPWLGLDVQGRSDVTPAERSCCTSSMNSSITAPKPPCSETSTASDSSRRPSARSRLSPSSTR